MKSTANTETERKASAPGRLSLSETWHDLNLREIVSSADPNEPGRPTEPLMATCRTLLSERDRYRLLFELSSVGQLILDADGIILEANRTGGALLDMPADALSGQPLTRWMANEDRSKFREFLAFARNHQQNINWVGQLQTKYKSVFRASLTLTALPNESGKPEIYGCVVQELLRGGATHSPLADRLALIGERVIALVHESGNILQGSHACLERLAQRVQDSPEALDLVARAQEEYRRLEQLYDEIKDYAKPMRLNYQTCNLGQILQEAWLASTRATSKQALLEETGNSGNLDCEVDRFRVQQVLRNIVDNSLAAANGSVRIQVEWSAEIIVGRPAVRCAVRDDGPGLDQQQRRRIFEPFYTTKARGLGLGMAISKSIIEAHGGRIMVADHPGPGTEIIITLPRSKE
jgi:PAS domain S-box-containing protein